MTFRPTLHTIYANSQRVALVVDVTTRFRIPLTFSAHFFSPDGTSTWEFDWMKCEQDDHLVSVRAVRDRVAEHAEQVLNAHLDEITPLVDAAREIAAANALQGLYTAETRVAEATRSADRSRAAFTVFGVSEERADEVLHQLRSKNSKIFGRAVSAETSLLWPA
ncbi:hypothetical protein ACFXKF_36565 [Streptomyces scopuliridis]|uniref:hypothetical protein n=1 Tax=Streptomyces scopuliridis TaxID=452529 RepID=UPI00369F69A1